MDEEAEKGGSAKKGELKAKKRGKDGKPKEESKASKGPTKKEIAEKKKKEEQKGGNKAKDDKPKVDIMDIATTKKTVEEYMLRHNRPYSIQDILNCYQSTMRKKQCEEALVELVAEKAVTLKEYGKAKVFLINQDRFPEVDPTLLDELDE